MQNWRPEYCHYWEYEQHLRPRCCQYWAYKKYITPSSSSTRTTNIRNTRGRSEYREYWTRKYCTYSLYLLPKYSQCSTVRTPIPPLESDLLHLVGPSIKPFCNNMGIKLSESVHRWSKYTSYSEHTAHMKSTLVSLVLAVPTDEILPVVGSSRGTEP